MTPRLFLAAASLFLAGVTLPLAATAQTTQQIQHFGIDNERPFSSAVRAGQTVYVSGQLGTTPAGLVKGFDAQAHQAMKNIAAILAQQNLGMANVVKCTVFLNDMSKWPAFNEIYKSYFKAGAYPARSALGANGLALGADLEVECIAYVPA
jgi:2-iminobutanoate/2-iminopropanoate deaminase